MQEILYGALCAPIEQILENAGENVKEIRDEVCKCNKVPDNYGYDVKNKKFGDMYKMNHRSNESNKECIKECS